MASLLERYQRACTFTQVVDPRRVTNALAVFFKGLGVRVTISQFGSLTAAEEAACAEEAWDGNAADAAWAFRIGQLSRAARDVSAADAAWYSATAMSARAARDVSAADAASAGRAARAAWAKRAGRPPWAFRDASASWIAWDASVESIHCLGFHDVGDTKHFVKWRPYFEAFEAGLWYSFHLANRVAWVPIPSVIHRNPQNRLHRDGAAALQLPMESWYFLHGVWMNDWMVLTPAEQLPPRKILEVPNAEQRRELLRKVGVERFIQDVGATTLDVEGDYTLLAIEFNGASRPYLKMRNPSTGCWHVEGVPPGTKTVTEALRARQPEALRALPVDDAAGSAWYQQGDVCVWPRDAVSVTSRPTVMT